jgi:hypothetical protein
MPNVNAMIKLRSGRSLRPRRINLIDHYSAKEDLRGYHEDFFNLVKEFISLWNWGQTPLIKGCPFFCVN